MRVAIAAAVMSLAICGVSVADGARASVRKNTDIPAQNLGAALQALAKDRDLQIVYFSKRVDILETPGARGELTIDEALTKVLAGTGLTYRYLDDRTVTVVPAISSRKTDTEPQDQSRSSAGGARQSRTVQGINMAQVAEARAQAPADSNDRANAAPPVGQESARKVDEIIVTAQKRVERLQDVPVPVTAIDAEALADSNQLRLQDYYNKIPGLSLILLGNTAEPTLTIRGVTTGGYTNPTVGIVVDDLAFGTSTTTGGGSIAPDFDPSELARIEVLRGPQGTLYGASSLGGLLKYVTVDPSTDRAGGRVQAGVTSVENGDGVGYSLRGAVNMPLGAAFAVRVSGYKRTEPGYVDNVLTGEQGVNERDAEGGRLSALWRPSESFSLKLGALFQNSRRNGEDVVHRLPGLSDWQHSLLADTGWYDLRVRAYSATLTARLGEAELTSMTGYSTNANIDGLDARSFLGAASQPLFGVNGATSIVDLTTKKFTQEARLSIPVGARVSWLLGLFYTDEDSPQDWNMQAVDPATGAFVGSWVASRTSSAFNERAVFTDLTFQVTDRFDVQIGGRASRTKFATGGGTSTGPYNTVLLRQPTLTVTASAFESKDNSFTYLLTPRLKVSPDLMVYARFASGYRPGGPNTAILSSNLGLSLPSAYEPDTTQNYEIGAKGNLFGGILSFDASVYYIDWKDLQIQLREPVSRLAYFINTSRAKSQGAELSIEVRPLADLTIGGWVAYNDAQLTEAFPPSSTVAGLAGNRLPYSSPWSGNLSVEQRLPLTASVSGFIGGSVSYVGDRKGRFFTGSVPRETFPAYTQLDLRAGLRYDTWTLNTFVNNIADKRGVLRAGNDSSLNVLYAVNYIQPRTFGMSISKSF